MYYVKNENAMAGCLCTDSFDASKPYSTHHFTVSTTPQVKVQAGYQPGYQSDYKAAADYQPFKPSGPVNSGVNSSMHSDSSMEVMRKQPTQYSPYQAVPQAYPLLPPTCGIIVERPQSGMQSSVQSSMQPAAATSCQMQPAAAVHNSLRMMPNAVSRTLQPAMYRKQPAACCGAAAAKQPARSVVTRSIQPIVRNTATTLQTRGKRSAGIKPVQYMKRPSQFDATEVNRPFDYITDYGTAYGYSADSPDLQNFYTYNNVEMDDFDPFYVSPVDVNSVEYQDALKKFYETVGYPNFSPKPSELMFGPEFFKYGEIKKF